MSLVRRGGVPRIVRISAPTAGTDEAVPPQATQHVQVRNTDSTNALRIYATEADFTADINYIELAAGEIWDAPAEICGMTGTLTDRLWLRGQVATVVAEIVWFLKLG